jgi:hypothetical protein
LRRSFAEISEPLPRAFELARKVFVFLPRGFDQSAKDGTGVRVVVERTFRMPLDGEDEVIRRRAFQRFNDVVIGTAGDDFESVADNVSRSLVVAGIGGDDERLTG